MTGLGSGRSQSILTGQTERIASVSSSAVVRKMAKVLVLATFFLLVAGALVTGNKAALSDPTWPQFVGHNYPKYWVGGLVYEDSHRLVAGLVGVLTLAMAIIVQVSEHRKFMKKLAWSAFGLVIVQALFGGLVIQSIRNPFVSMTHGVIAQAFFCLTIAMAVFSSKAWFRDQAEPLIERPGARGLLSFMKFAVGVIFLQVVMGGGVRHSNDNGDMFFPFIIAHIAGAFCVIVVVAWFNLRVWQVFRDIRPLRRTAIWSALLVGSQIALGILSIFANRARLQPGLAEFHHVFFSTTHLLVGASLLALMFGTFLRARQLLEFPTYAAPGSSYQSREVQA